MAEVEILPAGDAAEQEEEQQQGQLDIDALVKELTALPDEKQAAAYEDRDEEEQEALRAYGWRPKVGLPAGEAAPQFRDLASGDPVRGLPELRAGLSEIRSRALPARRQALTELEDLFDISEGDIRSGVLAEGAGRSRWLRQQADPGFGNPAKTRQFRTSDGFARTVEIDESRRERHVGDLSREEVEAILEQEREAQERPAEPTSFDELKDMTRAQRMAFARSNPQAYARFLEIASSRIDNEEIRRSSGIR